MQISIKNVTKYIKSTQILDSVSMDLHGGMIYGLQGPNGSGKTMLMRLIAGLIRPTTGEIFVNDKRLGKDCDFPTSLGALIEGPAFLPDYTGLKNLELLADIKRQVDQEQIYKTIMDVGLDPGDKRKYRKYSLGMKQRLAIAGAIMEKPELILLDEPTNALDNQGIQQICSLICRERDRGALVIMACHEVNILERLSDEIYMINAGKVIRKV